MRIDKAGGVAGSAECLILVALHAPARAAVMRRHEHQVATGDLRWPDHGREDARRGRTQAPRRGRP